MRPLAVVPIAGMPAFVRGLAIVRGCPIPVVDTSYLLNGSQSHPTRFVTVKTGSRRVALAVDAVVGIIEIPSGSLDTLPPLIRDTGPDAISAIGTLDAQLLFVLHSTRLVPEEVWATIQEANPSA